MALDFMSEDVIHKIPVKFVNASLPDAKKTYTLKTVFQTELDIHGIASKAEVYNIQTDPKVIEEGFNAACQLISYLSADGYKIKTPLFNLRIRVPGEYDGNESSLPEGVYPEVRFQTSLWLRNYIREKVKVEFTGFDQTDGLIAEAVDERTGQADETMTIGGLLTIRGYGLKIEGDADHAAQIGLFFDDGENPLIKADVLAINEPRTLRVIVPASLSDGKVYTLKIATQGTAKHGSGLLKAVREMWSEFKLIAHSS